ncbi:MAG: peptidylprolyl isomerase [Myxococcota bacterium]|nr:peptidylprolyl isomerase [Myxococcota bacterium]
MIAFILAMVVAQASTPSPSLTSIWAAEIRSAPASVFAPHITSPESNVRQQAALALGRLRASEALPLLQQLVQDPDIQVRATASFSLGQTPGSRNTILEQLAVETDSLPRQRLVAALGFQALDEDIPLFLSLLQDLPPIAREAAIGLGRLKISGSEKLDTVEVTTALSESLKGFNPALRTAAAFALSRIKPTKISDAAWQDLSSAAHRDRDPQIRARLTRALSLAAKEQDKDFFIRQAQDSEEVVRIATARSITDLGMKDPVQALISMLNDQSRAVRLTVAQELSKLEGVPNAVFRELTTQTENPALIAAALTPLLLQDPTEQARTWLAEHQPLVVRQAAVSSLSDPVQLLRIATEESAASLRTTAAIRLTELTPSPSSIESLLADQDSVVAGIALSYLSENPGVLQLSDVLKLLGTRAELDVALELLSLVEGLQNNQRGPAKSAVAEFRLHPDLAVRATAEQLATEMGLPPAPPGAFHPPLPNLASITQIRAARILTDAGEIRVELRPDIAPMAVHRFATLAEEDFYDGLLFHRVVPNFVIQTGCPRGDGWGGSKRLLPSEPSWLPYKSGVLGMADAGYNTAGSQWFIALSEQPHLEGRYTAFGALTLQNGVPKRVQSGTQILDVIIERTSATTTVEQSPTGEP